MNEENQILIRMSKVSNIWVIGKFGENSLVKSKRAKQLIENWIENELVETIQKRS